MRPLISCKGVFVLALLGLLSSQVQAAKVGYYEICYGEGQSWAIAPIAASGHTPVYLADLSASDLNGLDVLFVSNCSNQTYGDEYLARLPVVEQAVQNGLVVLIHDRKVAGASAILPGGSAIQSVRMAGQDVDVVDDSTAVTHGPGGVINSTILDGARNSDHGYLQAASLPAGGRVILSWPNPSHGVVSTYELGKGNVIYSTVPLDYYAGIMPICTRFSEDKQYQACVTIVNVYAPNVIDFAVQLANTMPVAKAGVDQAVDEGASVTLDGSASTGHGGLTYQWTQLSPASPQITLAGNSANPSFTAPDVSGNTTFTLQLVVTDIRGVTSAPDTVDISVKTLNNPPVADAGDALSIKPGKTAILNGGMSYDPEGDALTYAWQQLSGPAVILNNADSAQPTFTVPNEVGQVLVFELIVNDGQAASLPSQISVTIVANAMPLANAGLDQTRDEGAIVLLNALGSSDPDHDGLIFNWTQVDGPAVVLDNPGSPTPYFTAPRVVAGGVDLIFEVTVMDMDALNPKYSVDAVAVHVSNINDAPSCNLARPSVANLWPPNHKMRPIRIEGVSDSDSIYKTVSIVIDSVTMDEPVAGHGNGHSSPDAVIQSLQPINQVLLRAERKKHSNGRVYQVNFTANDGFESCTGSIKVSVPKSRRHHACRDDDNHGKHKGRRHGHHNQCQSQSAIDDGQKFDATLEIKHHDHDGDKDHKGKKDHDEKDAKKDHHDKEKKSKDDSDDHNKNKKHNNKNNK